jgi:hypothetical protein
MKTMQLADEPRRESWIVELSEPLESATGIGLLTWKRQLKP